MAYVTDDQGRPVSDGQGGFVSDGMPVLESFTARDAVFFVAEIDALQPLPAGRAIDTLRVSDQGYRTRASDPAGVVAYPGLLDTAFEIDRGIALDPSQAFSRSDGAIRITNVGNRFDGFVVQRNNDSRRVRILIGQKSYDPARGIYLDPPYGALRPFFAGSTASWLLAEDTLEVPVKDTAYWTSRPLQSKLYGGTGGLDGGAALMGKTIPVCRGGTPLHPMLNVSPVLVDAVANIWQYNDAPGTVVVLYEGGSGGKATDIVRAGDVADLYADSTPPGHFRTCDALGIFQLGSPSSSQITVDCTGAFPVAGQISTAVALAQAVLLETMGLPPEFCDGNNFAAVDAALPYVAGFWNDGTATGLQVVQDLLTSAGARLCSTRSGQLRPYLLQPVPAGAVGQVQLTPANAVSVVPAALPAALDPPPYRWRVGYARNYTVMTSGFVGDLPLDRKQFLAAEYRYAVWTGADVSAAWLRPGDPAPIETYLLDAVQAQAVATLHGVTWRGRPDCYTVTVPVAAAAMLDIGTSFRLAWPLGGLFFSATAVVTKEQIRSYDATATFEVLVLEPGGGFSSDFSSDFSGVSG